MSNPRRRKHHHHLKARNAGELETVFAKLRRRYPGREFRLMALDGFLLVRVAHGGKMQTNPEHADLGRGVGSRWERIRIYARPDTD